MKPSSEMAATRYAPPAGTIRPAALAQTPDSALRALTSGLARGDETAFDRFHEVWFDRLHRYLLVVSGGLEELAGDALQETMIRLIRHAKPFDDEADFWNWLRRIARSALTDQARRWRRSGAHIGGLTEHTQPAATEVTDAEDPATEMKAHLAACLQLLPAEERRLVKGKYLDGRSYAELAEERGISPKAVESRLARARRKLKVLMLESMKS